MIRHIGLRPSLKALAVLTLAAACAPLPGQALPNKDHAMHERQATGAFTVRMTPQPGEQAAIGMFALDKAFTGALAGTSTGTMMSAGDPATGSAGYVAIETFTGELDGRRGSFALQHSGTMHAGAQSLAIAVTPGSGTGALAGIAGTMTIRIEGGAHFYTLAYTLP